jgi:MFS family permease
MGAGPPRSTGSGRPREEATDRASAELPRLRDETDTERLDRNLVELLQEVRVVQTGVQVLFAFLLTVPFSARFADITGFQRGAYFAALVGAAAASVLLIAPTAVHRILFRLGQKEYMVEVSNRLTLGGLASTALAMIAAMLLVSDVMFGMGLAVAIAAATAIAFVGVWAAMPLRRRREVLAERRRARRR